MNAPNVETYTQSKTDLQISDYDWKSYIAPNKEVPTDIITTRLSEAEGAWGKLDTSGEGMEKSKGI